MSVSFLHIADPHIDSPLVGLSRYEGAPDVTLATRQAFVGAVDLAIAEEVDFVLIAGDLYDGDWRDFNTGLFACREFARLREAGIDVVLVAGNHDAANRMTKELRLPENVRKLSARHPETVTFDDLGVAIHGQSFATRAVTQDLSAGYPAPIGDLFNIGLLHTSASGYGEHEPYAPCSVPALCRHGYDYWALGHIHAGAVLAEEPLVVFPGNLQGRHVRETGAKGPVLVEIDGGHVGIKRPSVDVLRWTRLSVDAGGAATLDDILNSVGVELEGRVDEAAGRPVAARIELRGVTAAHAEITARSDALLHELRALATDCSGGAVWIEKVDVRTRSWGKPCGRGEGSAEAAGELLRTLKATATDPGALSALVDDLAPLKAKLPRELRDGDDGLRLDDPDFLGGLLGEIEQMLIPQLTQGDD